jgi:hypothetical protein
MKLALGLLLVCGGCSLYFGNSEGDGDSRPPKGDGTKPDRPDDPGKPDPGGPNHPGSDHPDKPCPTDPGDPPAPGPAACAHQVDVLSVYETSSAHAGLHDGGVTVLQPGVHTLVLVAYEQTAWHVSLAPGATVDAIHLYGYERSTVDGVEAHVFNHSAEPGAPACGYSVPDNGGGCDTDALLARVTADTGERIHGFHGCYRAVKWTLHADDTATSDCDTAAGYEQRDVMTACAPPP